MANIVKELKGRPGHLTTLVETGGSYFYVDSCYTLDHGYETMAFKSTPEGQVTDWGEVAWRNYDTAMEATTGHYEVIKDLEELMYEGD